jgi:NADH-quinone oxidoreductase subunit C
MVNIKEIIVEKFGVDCILSEDNGLLNILKIDKNNIVELCEFLKSDSSCYFDCLSTMVGIDNGPEKNTMEVVYHLYSIPNEHQITLKVELTRNNETGNLPELPTVSHIWHSANWDEREIYDLLGINFLGHPDLRRILMPEDWQGFPLRKDYLQQEKYHGINVKAE